MLAACLAALPADAAVCAAAVTDWRPADPAPRKLKKKLGGPIPEIRLTENPDILATLSKAGPSRPALVVGFALETEDLIENATAKLKSKGCDWIVANASTQDSTVFGSSNNSVTLVTESGGEIWPRLSKQDVGRRLASAIADRLGPAAGGQQQTGAA